MSDLPIDFRPPIKEDFAFLYSSWRKSDRRSGWNTYIPAELHEKLHAEAVENILQRGSNTLIAFTPAQPDEILGWINWDEVASESIVNFIYVPKLYRKNGIATLLLKRANVDVEKEIIGSHCSYVIPLLIKKGKLKGFVYMPNLKFWNGNDMLLGG